MPDGPAEHLAAERLIDIRPGEDPEIDFPVHDGKPVGGWPDGRPVELSGGTITGWLIVTDPAGGGDYTLQGTKVKTTDRAGITSDTFRFTIPDGVTDTWTSSALSAGGTLTPYRVEWRDSTGTRTRYVAVGKFRVITA